MHPEGLDDDDICAMTGITICAMTGITRQQVQQFCNHLAASSRIRRQSVEKPGRRRKIHNFPIGPGGGELWGHDESEKRTWRRRLSALVAATGRPKPDLLEEALSLLVAKVLRTGTGQKNSGSTESDHLAWWPENAAVRVRTLTLYYEICNP